MVVRYIGVIEGTDYDFCIHRQHKAKCPPWQYFSCVAVKYGLSIIDLPIFKVMILNKRFRRFLCSVSGRSVLYRWPFNRCSTVSHYSVPGSQHRKIRSQTLPSCYIHSKVKSAGAVGGQESRGCDGGGIHGCRVAVRERSPGW